MDLWVAEGVEGEEGDGEEEVEREDHPVHGDVRVVHGVEAHHPATDICRHNQQKTLGVGSETSLSTDCNI